MKRPPWWISLTFAAALGLGAIGTAIIAHHYLVSAPLLYGALHCFDVGHGRRSVIIEVAKALGSRN